MCIPASTVPTIGMLMPFNNDDLFLPSGELFLRDGLRTSEPVVVSKDIMTTSGHLGVGTHAPQHHVHVRDIGPARLFIEADLDDSGQFDHARIHLLQDAGSVHGYLGFVGGVNNLRVGTTNDSDLRFELPFTGTADWEFHKVVDPGTGTSSNLKGRLNQDGDWSIDGDVFTGGADLAEYYPIAGAVEPGDVVAFRGGGLVIERATAGPATRLAGIVSSDPGLVLGVTYTDEDETGVSPEDLFADTGRMLTTAAGHDVDRAILHEIAVDARAPLALTGRVPCKVTASNGAIAAGDLLTVSALPGHAMKATRAGAVIGTALEPSDAGEGTIVVLANLGWFSPT
jgi:hypothetical protein